MQSGFHYDICTTEADQENHQTTTTNSPRSVQNPPTSKTPTNAQNHISNTRNGPISGLDEQNIKHIERHINRLTIAKLKKEFDQ